MKDTSKTKRKLAARPLAELLGFVEAREREEEQLRVRTGAALRTARTSAGIPQTDVADALGVSASYLSQVENGNKAVSTPQLRNIYSALATAQAGGTDEQGQDRKQVGKQGKADARKARKASRNE